MRVLAKYLLLFILLCVAGCATPDIFPREPTFGDSDLEMGGAERILIPAGNFLMGSPKGEGYNNEHPQHTVFLDAFYIDKYEVTNAQYKQFTDATGHRNPKSMDAAPKNLDHPVEGVSWYDARDYCEWAGKRLPTEAEWEKAARGGLVGKKYPWGDSITHDDANYDGIGGKDQWKGTAPVGSFAPNGYGLYDMAGNVWGWCADWRNSGYYAKSPPQNPKGPAKGNSLVMRGGSWRSGSLRVALRGSSSPSVTHDGTGFRCASDKFRKVKYFAIRDTYTFHRRLECPWVSFTLDRPRVKKRFYYTRKKAIADRKGPCPVCMP